MLCFIKIWFCFQGHLCQQVSVSVDMQCDGAVASNMHRKQNS